MCWTHHRQTHIFVDKHATKMAENKKQPQLEHIAHYHPPV